MNIGLSSISFLEREYAKALSLGDKKRAEGIKAQAEAILNAAAPDKFRADSGTYQAEPGFFLRDTGTVEPNQGRF